MSPPRSPRGAPEWIDAQIFFGAGTRSGPERGSVALVALVALGSLSTVETGVALGTLLALNALVALDALIALSALLTLSFSYMER